MHTQPILRAIKLPTVTQMTSCGRTKIYEMVAAGEFPQPIKLGPRAVAWAEHEVQEWLAKRLASRPTAHGQAA